MSQLVTGDAVVLELRLARLPSRVISRGIDATVQFGIALVTSLVIDTALSGVNEALAAAISLVVTVGILLGYPVTMETLTRGRTLGKMALGLRVVRDDGGPIRLRHAMARGLLGVVEIYVFGFIALIASLASIQGKRLGDQLAGTVVVRERMPVRESFPVGMPPGLQSWAAQLDLSRMPESAATSARALLFRWQQLDPQVRDGMAANLAGVVGAAVTPPPPPGVPPTAYLSAVLAERHRRELARHGAPVFAGSTAPPPPPPRYAQPGYVAQPGYAPQPQGTGAQAQPPSRPEPLRPPEDPPAGGGFSLPG